ncbi:cation:proton antiporter [Candidatus Woesearchaeota archaeon]|nr:cation:proton antiporter [Candidatus Woesearchaeota archaeon]
MNPDVFIELTLILIITVITTGIVRALKQPAVIGYIVSGILAGPLLFDVIDSADTLGAFSHIGVAMLLFFVGLNMNPQVIKDVGKVSLFTGIGQVVFTSGIGYLIARALGFDVLTSVYLAIALAFSSTIIIMKLLSDRKDLESMYGRISIGFLIVQDFIAIFTLLVISSLSSEMELTSIALQTIVKGTAGVVILLVLAKYILPPVMKLIAKSQEFLLLFSITWCFSIASLFHQLNFSIEAGALLAGMALSMSPYHIEISSKMKPLRDFFLVLFFIMLGSQMVFSNILDSIWLIIALSLFVLIGNPIIVMTLMGIMGYTKRNGFFSGLTVAQISEFSFILISAGVVAGHVSQEVLSIVTAVGLITFAGSTYLILYADRVYSFLAPYLSIFEKKGEKVDEVHAGQLKKHDIILFGYNRIGFDVLQSMKKIKKKFLIVEYDPDVIEQLKAEGIPCVYGDANDSELLDKLDLEEAKMVVSTIPNVDTNLLIAAKLRAVNEKSILAVVSHQIDEAIRLYEEGASYVIMPHFLGGRHFSTMIENHGLNMKKFLKEKVEHIEHIKEKKQMGHEHPKH